MARPPSRALVLTLFTGVTVLAVLYFGARARSWEVGRQVEVAVGIGVIAAAVYAADWFAHRRRAGE